MSETRYQDLAAIISRVRNAKFSDMVTQLERLIDSSIWRDYTTPVGTNFKFEACEFDYFLAAQEIDPTTVRYAYLKADGVEGLAAKQVRLADITGRGKPPVNGDRRARDEVARIYGSDPSGAGSRIRSGKPVVTDRLAQVAADPQRRSEYEATGKGRERAKSKFWRVRWSDDTSTAEAIAGKLLEDPDLAREVYRYLDAERVRTGRDQKRRSDGES